MTPEIAHVGAVARQHEPIVAALARAVLSTEPSALILVADVGDATARELLHYAARRLAELQVGAIIALALSHQDGCRLLATPEHSRTPSVLDELAERFRTGERALVLIVAGGAIWAHGVRLARGEVVIGVDQNAGAPS